MPWILPGSNLPPLTGTYRFLRSLICIREFVLSHRMPLCTRQTAFLTRCPSAPGRLRFSPDAPLHQADCVSHPMPLCTRRIITALCPRHFQLFISCLLCPPGLYLQAERVQLISSQINQLLGRLRVASGDAFPVRQTACEITERHVDGRIARTGELVL